MFFLLHVFVKLFLLIYLHFLMVCSKKVVGCVTDNASNFVCAFKNHGINVDELTHHESDDEDERGEPVEFISIEDGALPTHFRCASHTLSLVGTKDAKLAMEDATYPIRFNQAFSKLNALCKKYNRPKSCELIKSMLGKSLVMPCKTRWNSLFDSIKRILEFDVTLLNRTVTLLNRDTRSHSIEEFTTTDIEFFTEYVKVMSPIAEGIDSLQTDEFYSFFLPTLTNIKYTIESLAAEAGLMHCVPLLEAVTTGFDKRFGHFCNLYDDRTKAALISTCVHPYFKTRWLHEDLHTGSNIKVVEDMLLDEAKTIIKEKAAPTKIEKEPIENGS